MCELIAMPNVKKCQEGAPEQTESDVICSLCDVAEPDLE